MSHQPLDTRHAIIIVSGMQGAGKTTVGRLLARRFARGVYVGADDLHKMIVSGGEWKSQRGPEDEPDRQLRLRLHNACLLGASCYDAGFTAVLDDIIIGARVQHLLDELAGRPFLFVMLTPSLDSVRVREAGRGTHLHEAWGWMDDEIRTGTPRLGLWIDSSAQTAEQTVDEIMHRAWSEGSSSSRNQFAVEYPDVMDYDASLRWLLTLPDFERSGDFAARPDVAPMLALLAELGDPHRRRPTVHIAGSKGKGSTGAMIEAVLRAAGMHTGYYISPHLHRYNERIRIDGQPIDRDAFAAAMTRVREAIEAVAPRFSERQFLAFDALTAAGFVAFRDAGVDVQIVEVGLGGLLDSTNVFHQSPVVGRQSSGEAGTVEQDDAAHVVVLTPISLEHTAILGDTIAAIAAQKAGIITDAASVIVAPQRESALDVFRASAAEHGATIVEVAAECQLTRTTATADGQRFKLKTSQALYDAELPLAGRHQLDNAATAIVASEALSAHCGIELTPAHVSAGLAKIAWPGRLEVLTRKPLVIVDGAHNGDSAKRMVAALREYFGLAHVTLLFGTLAGKDVASMADAVAPIAREVFVASWPSARAADPRDLAQAFRTHDVPVSTFGSLPQAYDAALAQAGERGAVVAFGAIAFVAAVREYVLGIESDAVRLATGSPTDSG